MGNFRIQVDTENDVIIIRYYDTAYYRTLLKSISELLSIKMAERYRIVLDFSAVKDFLITYHQIINFRQGLEALLPEKTVSRVAIINAPKASWGGMVCSSSASLKEKDFLEFPLRCFDAHQKSEAYQWI